MEGYMKINIQPAQRAFLFVVIINMSLAGQVIAGSFEDAMRAKEEKHYEAAFSLLKPLAEQGDSLAQNEIGLMYQFGDGLLKDYKLAHEWYLKSAKQGNGHAMFNLHALYFLGNGVPRDKVESYKWLILADKYLPDKAPAGEWIKQPMKEGRIQLTPEQIAEAERRMQEWIKELRD
jgi:hypothetical protein